MAFEEPTGNTDGIDADALLNEIESGGNRDIPMSAGQEDQPPATATMDTPAPSLDLEFDYNGKQIKVPFADPKVKQWAQQGYDYAQKMAQFNQERQQVEGMKKQYEDQYAPYKTIDEYAKQNPEWWAKVESAFKAKDQAQEQGQAVPDWVKNKLEETTQFIEQLKSKEAAEAQKAEDEALIKEIESIRKQYANLDWDAPDEHGQSLEKRILKHAVDNDIKSFRVAFRDYNHDSLLKLHEERGKEAVTKELQKRKTQGIIGQSSTSQKGVQPVGGVKNKSYEDIMREAKEELGIA